jgi:hypothetical protein
MKHELISDFDRMDARILDTGFHFWADFFIDQRKVDTGWDMEIEGVVGSAVRFQLCPLGLIRVLLLDRIIKQMQSSAREE